ncbi:unnamed protein product, partial [Mesorhabditis spiculigera]
MVRAGAWVAGAGGALFAALYLIAAILQQPLGDHRIEQTTKDTIPLHYTDQSPGRPQQFSTLTKEDIFSQCRLTIHDPYSGAINRTIEWRDPLAGCQKGYEPATQLVDGKISIAPRWTDKIGHCRARCHEYASVRKYSPGPWIELGPNDRVPMECDFVYAECLGLGGHIVDQYIHSQIVETEKRTYSSSDFELPREDFGPLPNVHIFLIDSVSSTQARRSLPKTLDFLEHQMGGVQFHHLNKVGDNSRPNGYALFMGKRVYEMEREALGGEDLKPEMSYKQHCHEYRDEDAVIFKLYEKMGYKTLYNEEYLTGDMWSWPATCRGFEKQPTTHCYRPIPATLLANEKLRRGLPRKCIEQHHLQYKYHQQFLEAYQ